ncbi:MAG TPA: O-antigen ligase family protein [Saprospiraceae bacterium]|nr:O-antigen ligase family protein [Saprospiraceae bacterium]
MKLTHQPIDKYQVFKAAGIFVLLLSFLASYFEQVLLLAIPLVLIMGILFISDYRLPYYLYFLVMPLSVEYYFPSGFGTDLPTEPLMLIMTASAFVLFLSDGMKLMSAKYLQPITYALMCHVCWIGVTAFASESPFISLKILLAKIWYIIPFYFLSLHLIKNPAFVKKIMIFTFWPLLLATIYIIIRHTSYSFSFESVNHVVRPFFRNHVSYASVLVLFVPFVWFLYKQEQRKTMKYFYLLSMIVMVVGIYFSYTRAAILSLILAFGCYYLIKWRLFFKSVLLSVPILIFLVYFLVKDNNYVRFAPNFERTVTHNDFGNLLDATYKLEDISTMERVYRWVAGAHMVAEKPYMGFGPGTFYTYYQNYTVTMFETYVSDNPEKSGMHNNFLMILVEQGFPGLVIFLIFCLLVLYQIQEQYLKTKDENEKILIMSAGLCIIIILLTNLINDTLEVDKIGPFFFLSIAIIARSYWLNNTAPNISKIN